MKTSLTLFLISKYQLLDVLFILLYILLFWLNFMKQNNNPVAVWYGENSVEMIFDSWAPFKVLAFDEWRLIPQGGSVDFQINCHSASLDLYTCKLSVCEYLCMYTDWCPYEYFTVQCVRFTVPVW